MTRRAAGVCRIALHGDEARENLEVKYFVHLKAGSYVASFIIYLSMQRRKFYAPYNIEINTAQSIAIANHQ